MKWRMTACSVYQQVADSLRISNETNKAGEKDWWKT